MIEFNGYLTGAALKYFYKRYTKFLQVFMAVPLLIGYPILAFLLADKTKPWVSIIVFILVTVNFVFLPHLFMKIDKKLMKSDKRTCVPKQIFIKNNIIVCISNQVTENQQIEVVKEVQDYGEYYALKFTVLGFFSPNFVCQKNLLTKGSLEDFEALFEGKIVKKVKNKTGDGSLS